MCSTHTHTCTLQEFPFAVMPHHNWNCGNPLSMVYRYLNWLDQYSTFYSNHLSIPVKLFSLMVRLPQMISVRIDPTCGWTPLVLVGCIKLGNGCSNFDWNTGVFTFSLFRFSAPYFFLWLTDEWLGNLCGSNKVWIYNDQCILIPLRGSVLHVLCIYNVDHCPILGTNCRGPLVVCLELFYRNKEVSYIG